MTFQLIYIALLAVAVYASDMPLPFTRVLRVTSPLMTGNDVIIAQNLLKRDTAVKSLTCDGVYGSESASATSAFQSSHGIAATGNLDSETANLLLNLHSNDNYKDTGFTAASMGYLYKIYLPVHYNRSIGKYVVLEYFYCMYFECILKKRMVRFTTQTIM